MCLMKFVQQQIKTTTMESHFTSNNIQEDASDFDNIIRINIAEEDDLMDFDFDYDPNEMYYALANE